MSSHHQALSTHQRVECFLILAAERFPCPVLNLVDLFPEEPKSEESSAYLDLW